MKKIICVILSITIALTMLTACGNTPKPRPSGNMKDTILKIQGADKTTLTWGEFLEIKQYTFEIKRTNSKGVTTKAKYQGVKWEDLAKEIGAENATKVTLIASDGFEQAFTVDTLKTGNSIFAVYQDGKNISENPLDGQVWFCADESLTANNWAKYVEKIIVE